MTPLELFVGRAREIRAFEELVAPNAARWVMLVTGLSGTGKSLLIDWLRQYRCAGVRHAKVQLTPNTTAPDFLRLLAAQLGESFESALGERLDALDEIERRGPLVQVSPTITMEGKLGGRIDEAVQTSNTVVNLESAAEIEALERETRRLDALVSVIRPLGAEPWVLFIDEAEQLDDRTFGRFLLERLVPRLRSRFPGFRFYLSGQSLPQRAPFQSYESAPIELGPFDGEETAQLLEKAGVGDAAIQRRVMELTAGHPLLLGMLLEHSDLGPGALELRAGRSLPDRLDQGVVTAWIYQRILDRLPEAVRPVAADLALFDWFDLSILRASFDAALEEPAFRDLSRRSFVKAIGPGQWRCHDIVRRHLAAARREADPEAVAALCARIMEAFLQQLRTRGEREGQPFFAGRLDYLRGALAGASGFSAQRALDLMVDEFLKASADQTNDYLFGLTHMMGGEGVPQAVRAFGKDTRRFLERLNAEQSDAWALAFAERLASDAQRLGDAAACEMYQVVAQALAQQCGDWSNAERLARALVEAHPSLDNRLLLSRTLASAGAAEEARQLLETIRAETGDTVELLTGFGLVELIVGNTEQAQRFLADAIAASPQGAQRARLHLARLLFAADRDEEALLQVERLLEIEPGHEEAERLRLDVLAWLGRYRSIALPEGQAAALIRESEDQIAQLLAGDDPRRLLGAIAEDATAVPVPLLLAAGEITAARGQSEELERIHAVVLARAPEAKDLVDLQRLTLLLANGDAERAVHEAEEMLTRRPDLPGAYFILSQIYAQLGRYREARELLGRLTASFPSLTDQADQMIATSHLAEASPEAALDYLHRRAEEGSLGAKSNMLRAVILSANGQPDKACEVLERVVATAGRDQLSVSGMVGARRLYGMLSAATGAVEQARTAATDLVELFPSVPMAKVAALEIYGVLGDERAVRAIAARIGEDAPLTVRLAVLGELGKLVFRRHQGDAEQLLDALRREPGRLDLITAVLLASQSAPAQQAAELAGQAYRLAPRGLIELQRLSTEAMVADPRVRQAVMEMRRRQDVPPLTRLGLDVALASHGYLPLEEARQELQEVAREFPELATAVRVAEANLLLELDKLEEAGALLAPFLAPGAMIEQAVLPSIQYLKRRGDWEAAASLLEEAAKAFPADRLALFELRADLLIDHDPARALQELEALRDEAPLTIGLSMSLANALGQLKRPDDAIKAMADALLDLRLDDGERAMALRILGRWQREAGQIGEAVESLRAAAALQPGQAAPLLDLSRALEAAERWSEAYAAARDAVALEPRRLVTLEGDLQRLKSLSDAGTLPQPLGSATAQGPE